MAWSSAPAFGLAHRATGMTDIFQQQIPAVILVGGSGTRLRSVVSDRPKPMAEVAGRPFVEWILLALRTEGVRRVIFCTGHMGEMVEAHFGDGNRWNVKVEYSRDPMPLGTAGAARNALNRIQEDRCLVLNGDSYCRIDLRRLIETHLKRRASATLWLMPMDDCRRYGTVAIEKNDAISAFAEKSSKANAGLVNAGVYLMERSMIAGIPEGRAISLENDIFPGLIGRGLCSVKGRGPFLDIGTPESYVIAESFLAAEISHLSEA
jgi:D-glycero-alpha-D-manno-heptose 1-phosphate guanylyltransferase